MMIPIYKSDEQQDSLYRYYHKDVLGFEKVGAKKTSERKTLTPHMMLSGDD